MTITARFAALGIACFAGAPAFAETATWECRVERRIEASKTTMYSETMRADPAQRFVFVADTRGNRGCVLASGAKACETPFTGASESGGMLRLDRVDEHGKLDLVNIFVSSGRFVRIHGDTQWMGKASDCVRSQRVVKLP